MYVRFNSKIHKVLRQYRVIGNVLCYRLKDSDGGSFQVRASDTQEVTRYRPQWRISGGDPIRRALLEGLDPLGINDAIIVSIHRKALKLTEDIRFTENWEFRVWEYDISWKGNIASVVIRVRDKVILEYTLNCRATRELGMTVEEFLRESAQISSDHSPVYG